MPQLVAKSSSHVFRRVLIFAVVAVVLTAGGVAAMWYRTPLARALALATTHQPETYTELYFVNNRQLPSLAPAGKTQTFAFGITNHEARTVTYRYVVSMTIDGNSVPAQTGSVVLASGQSRTLKAGFRLAEPGKSAVIGVNLAGRGEQIDFRSRS